MKLAMLGLVLCGTPSAATELFAQGYSREQAASKMVLPQGFQVKLFAAEPEVRQPILVKFDERGRLWVIQYLQYPNPSGLQRVKVDRWSRTRYDQIPKPPPHGPRGADKITIFEDADGDGRADSWKDFVDGLNLCTGLEFGHGGVFVLQVPYLLFYPDRNRDDVPDGDPQVLLEGFGMEDAQSLANHLTWGPDGWLYGLNGSTTTCNIRGLEFQQGVWRYHPVTKEFELFCEGGGNVFGLTFDEQGDLFYSSNGGLFWHALQGGYFEKNLGKHGPLHNPFAYGYLPHVEHQGPTGGPNTGGTVYLGNSFPESYRGAFITGNFLGHACSWWKLTPQGSTVTAMPAGLLLDARDTWFGPTDMCLGPDGSMFVCDFFDKRTAHPDPDAQWDTSNGRVYKIEAAGTRPVAGLDLAKLSSHELVDLLTHPNGWYAQQARRLLADRHDPSIVSRLRDQANQADNPRLALQSLWAIHVSGGLDDALTLDLLEHPSEYVRLWTVRLMGDAKQVSQPIAARLNRLAEREPSAVVRSQLAASAKRLPGPDALPVVQRIVQRDLDDNDPRIAWALWWALEDKAVSDRQLVLDLLVTERAWQNGSFRGNLRRLLRRYASEGSAAGYAACERLLEATPSQQLETMLVHLDLGLSERARGLIEVGQGGLFQSVAEVGTSQPQAGPRTFQPVTEELRTAVDRLWREQPSQPLRIRLAIQSGIEAANRHVLSELTRSDLPETLASAYLELLQALGQEDCVPHVLPFVAPDRAGKLQLSALAVLGRFGDERVTSRLIAVYPRVAADVQSRIRDVLFSRRESTREFLRWIDRTPSSAAEVPLDQLRRVALHQDEELSALVRKYWGNIQPGTAEEKLATMRRLANDLRAGSGEFDSGRELFKKHCANCHKLLGEGTTIGPDLTEANRRDREFLLASIVDPSAVIRSQYLNQVVITHRGAVYAGLLAEQDAASLTLLDAKNQRTRIPRDQIEELRPSPLSLMPEKLLDLLSPQELRDLFHYLSTAGK